MKNEQFGTQFSKEDIINLEFLEIESALQATHEIKSRVILIEKAFSLIETAEHTKKVLEMIKIKPDDLEEETDTKELIAALIRLPSFLIKMSRGLLFLAGSEIAAGIRAGLAESTRKQPGE